jgi:hypothetical protein
MTAKTTYYEWMKILFFVLILVKLSSFAMAQERRLIVIRGIQGAETLPPALSRQLEKITMQVVVLQPGLELLLSGTNSPTRSAINALAIEGEVRKAENGYRFETRLLNLKTNKLVNRSSLDQVREEDLLRLYESALNNLFDPLEKGSSAPRKASPKEKKDQDINPAPKVPKTQPLNVINEIHPSAVDFREIVKNLKIGVDDQVSRKADENALEKKKDQDPKPLVTATIDRESPAAAISQKELSLLSRASLSYPARHSFSFGYQNRSVNSISFIDTSTNATFLGIQGSGHFPWPYFNGKVGPGYELSIERPASTPVEIPMLYQLGGLISYFGKSWILSTGIYRDKTFFVNLPSPGEGLTSYSLDATWVRVKTALSLDFKRVWTIEGSFGLPLGIGSDYTALKGAKTWTGSYLQASVIPPWNYLKFHTALNVENINLATQGERPFTLNELRMGLSIRRSL